MTVLGSGTGRLLNAVYRCRNAIAEMQMEMLRLACILKTEFARLFGMPRIISTALLDPAEHKTWMQAERAARVGINRIALHDVQECAHGRHAAFHDVTLFLARQLRAAQRARWATIPVIATSAAPATLQNRI